MHLCHVTVRVSNSLLFTGNYKNLHTKSSDITFTHPVNIYLLNICCLADTIPGLSHRTVEAESGCASNGTGSSRRQTLHAVQLYPAILSAMQILSFP